MSSTGPIPQPGAELWTRSMDVLQEMIQKLTLAQEDMVSLKGQIDTLSQPSTAELLELQQLMNQYTEAVTLVSNMVQKQQNLIDRITRLE